MYDILTEIVLQHYELHIFKLVTNEIDSYVHTKFK